MSRFLLFSIAFFLIIAPVRGDWRGFRGDGTAISNEKNLPAKWTKETILWKTELPGLGSSSPIVVGDRVFVTCYSGYGQKLTQGFKGGSVFRSSKAGKQDNLRLHLVCVDRNKGKTLWKKEIKPALPEAEFKGFLREHGYASGTPVSDGKRVYVFFGKTGVFAFDLDGKQIWQTDVGEGTHKFGSGSSPVLAGDTLVINASIESQALIGLDKNTGQELWKVKALPCWVSPVVVQLANGQQEVVFNEPLKIMGIDPRTGKVLWHCKGIGGKGDSGTTCSTPAVQGETVIMMANSPFIQATIIAIQAGGRGDISKTKVLWRVRGGSGICSPVVSGDHVYWVEDVAYCASVKDGKILSRKRLHGNRVEYGSAIVADGKIFAQTRFDGLFVLAEDKDLKPLAQNKLAGDDSIFNATPAISDGQIFIRSNRFLYCIGKK